MQHFIHIMVVNATKKKPNKNTSTVGGYNVSLATLNLK